ncbi:MAG: hypothetical protein NTU86_01870 [Burkholderiales bacterium]|nr:hypothetical protein [Burkholderiales bacterium]
MSYLKFLNLAQAIRSLPSFPSMDSCEEVLLNTLARKWDAGQQVTVVEAMNMLPDTSPSTVHRRLKTLRKKKFIALEGDQIVGARPIFLRRARRANTQGMQSVLND